MEQAKISVYPDNKTKKKSFRLIRGLHNLPSINQGYAATIGNFDGVHQGHRTMLALLEKQAKKLALATIMISFEPLPVEYFRRDKSHSRIYPLRDKLRQLKRTNIDNFLCLAFNQRLASMPADVFVRDLLLKRLAVRYLIVGDDFRFGHQRKGDYALLRQMGQQHGMQVRSMSTFRLEHKRVSSTRVRQHLSTGDLQTAHHLLGHAYCLSGRVRHGDKQGRTIGFPTLNLAIPENLALQRGVYVVHVHGINAQALPGVANLGNRPTVNGRENRLEIHLLNYDAQLYGHYVQVEFIKQLRTEKRFDSLDALKAQINKDVLRAKKILAK